ncbi:1-phosphofructokinase [Halosolutus amylolyticus]|uniref:1-phosphofructokinase n=1 Tax=Halosolutus amylolyticus TaxID=2932267 RepID=A0ABD5PRX9_9EURY|nr:1-phosphofructokinase [Halosolutus amylolyticus]
MILTVTLNPAVDHTITVEGDLDADVVKRASMSQYDPGGKGINVSKYLHGLGVETVATGLTGGFLGSYIEEQLARQKIPNDFVEMGGCTRLNTTILSDEEEYKINQSGHNVKKETIREVVAKVSEHDPEMVVVAGSLPPNLGPATIDRIASAGSWRTVVDVQGDLLKGLRSEYFACKPNRRELGTATGMPVHSVEECVEAAQSLREEGFEHVVASLGEDGALLASPEGVYRADSRNVEVVDTVGAGDALLAGVLSTFARGQSGTAALRMGVTVAAEVVSVPGTTVPEMSGVRSESTDVPLFTR